MGGALNQEASGISCADHTVPTGRFFSGTLPRHFVPGYDRCCPYGTKYILRAGALIKLALMGFQPWWLTKRNPPAFR
jgi:hypothetical protein